MVNCPRDLSLSCRATVSVPASSLRTGRTDKSGRETALPQEIGPRTALLGRVLAAACRPASKATCNRTRDHIDRVHACTVQPGTIQAARVRRGLVEDAVKRFRPGLVGRARLSRAHNSARYFPEERVYAISVVREEYLPIRADKTRRENRDWPPAMVFSVLRPSAPRDVTTCDLHRQTG
jgi:hypothetical protein